MRISAIENDLARFMARQEVADFERSWEEEYQEQLWDEPLASVCERLELIPGTFLVEDIERRRDIINALEKLAAHGSVELHRADESLEGWSVGAIYDSLPLESDLRHEAEEAMQKATPFLMEREKWI